MKRAPIVIGATGVGLGLLFSFHTKPVRVSIAATATGPSGAPSGGSANGSGAGPGPTPTTAPAGGTTSPTTAGVAPASTSPTSATATRSATGQDVQYMYGDIQLRVTERGSKITSIKVVSEGATDPRSAEINSLAVPMLQRQAMSVQSANIDGVSGATFTSMAYQQALQSALDQLPK